MIKNRIIKTALIDWHSVNWLQDGLKTSTPDNLTKLKNSIKANQFIMPFTVWQENKKQLWILDGHHRKLALEELEKEGTEIPKLLPANFVDVENKKEACKLVLLYSSLYAEIQNKGLEDFLANSNLSLNELVNEINLPDVDLTEYFKQAIPKEQLDDVPELQKESISKLGDLFELGGKHRVLCGDATNKSHVEALMGEIRADMVFTDPPYNVNYEGYTKDKLTIKGDAMADNKYADFLNAVFKNYRKVIKDGCGLYICHADAWQRLTEEILNLNGIVMRNQIIWAKNTFAWGMGRYKFQHEPIFYAYVKGKSDAWYGDRKASTLWQVNKPSRSEEHPTMKPIELITIALSNSSKMQDIVLDTFLGSGSTLIACEQTNRICYGMEIDPIYIDVILRRYHKLYPDAKVECLNRKFDFDKLWQS